MLHHLVKEVKVLLKLNISAVEDVGPDKTGGGDDNIEGGGGCYCTDGCCSGDEVMMALRAYMGKVILCAERFRFDAVASVTQRRL